MNRGNPHNSLLREAVQPVHVITYPFIYNIYFEDDTNSSSGLKHLFKRSRFNPSMTGTMIKLFIHGFSIVFTFLRIIKVRQSMTDSQSNWFQFVESLKSTFPRAIMNYDNITVKQSHEINYPV